MALNVRKNVSLTHLNTFRIDVSAADFVEISTLEDLKKLRDSAYWKIEPKLILGGGSNLLFKKNYPGLVIKMSLKGISVNDEGENVYLKVMSGENWHQLVEFAIERGFAGIENLSLIPGCVGAAPIQNIGAYGVELESCFESLEAMEKESGEIVTFYKKDCQFGYRDSVFKNVYKDKFIITSVTLKLSRTPKLKLDYGAIRETIKKFQHDDITLKDVSKAVVYIRQSKLPDPKVIGNAGSFFKNPVIDKKQFSSLLQKYPEMPHYHVAEELVKVPAGWLVEMSGLKGFRKGNAGVHAKQALVIVNHGGATGEEVFEISEHVKNTVYKKFGVDLQREVNVIG